MKTSALQIVKTLRAAGYEAYWAGGCVRDILLGITPKDFDIATNAKPEEIEKLLSKTVPIGKKFGVILAMENGHHFEVATFRSDSDKSDGRRPDAVFFSTAEEDAKRRDFTINALFYDPIEDKILDFVEGQKDLEAHLVRFIGDPDKRILEDHLRILRAIRFKNVYDFQYHPDTFAALKHHAHHLKKISRERIRDELNKILFGKRKHQAFEELYETGILHEIIPEMEQMKGLAQPYEYHQEGDVWEHALLALESVSEEADLITRLAVMLHDIGKTKTFELKERIRFDGHAEKSGEIVKQIMGRLKYSKKEIEQVSWIVSHHMMLMQILQMPTGKRRKYFLHPDFPKLLEVARCDVSGTRPSNFDMYNELEKIYEEDMRHMPKAPDRLLTGDDVMEILHLPKGPLIGQITEQLNEKQLAKEITTREEAIEWLKSLDIKNF